MTDRLRVLFGWLKRVGEAVVDPLRKDPESTSFRLSSPETHTTTIDGGIGWPERPPAFLDCPQCGSPIHQEDSRADIDCRHCVAEFSHEEFTDLDLRHMVCPVCGDQMEHGSRHPHSFDVPEWATCHSCRYHWEFKHSY